MRYALSGGQDESYTLIVRAALATTDFGVECVLTLHLLCCVLVTAQRYYCYRALFRRHR
jgi:hypothetical protein